MKTITYDETQWKLVPLDPDDTMCDAAYNAPLPLVLLDSLADRRALEFRTSYKAAIAVAPEPPAQPIPMILHCPSCGEQHIDAPDADWDNPPHRSHLCHGCGTIWRPADVPTTGVERIQTKGSADRVVPPAVRDWPEDTVLENGNYECRCIRCGLSFVGYKRRVLCRVCDPLTVQPAPKNAFVKLCIYERRHGTFATLGSRVLFGAVISPTGQPTRTYKIPLDDLREIIDHAVRTGEQE